MQTNETDTATQGTIMIDQQTDNKGAIEHVSGEIREVPGVIRQYWHDGRWHDMFFRAVDEKRKPLMVSNQLHHAATWEHYPKDDVTLHSVGTAVESPDVQGFGGISLYDVPNKPPTCKSAPHDDTRHFWRHNLEHGSMVCVKCGDTYSKLDYEVNVGGRAIK